jgi:hypothetical protein
MLVKITPKFINKVFLLLFQLWGYHAFCQKSFEGVAEYKITFIPKSENNTYIAYQTQKYGKEVNIYYSKTGYIRRDYITSGEKGYDFFVYNPFTNETFTKWRNFDTIYTYNAAKNSLILINQKNIKDTIIQGEKCKGYLIEGKGAIGEQKVALTYYYPKKRSYYINSRLFKKYNDFFFHQMIKKVKTPFSVLIMDMQFYTVIFELKRIKEGFIDQNVFELPNNIPLKKGE